MGERHTDKTAPRIVWAPLPVLSWVLPLVGHVGATDSAGNVHDFAGPRTVNTNALMCGPAVLAVDIARVWPHVDPSAWDAALADANARYARRTHNIIADNCHHHVACALARAGVRASAWSVWWAVARHGRYVASDGAMGGLSARLRVWGPFLLLCLLAALLALFVCFWRHM